jgi:hypothetical protein
MMLLAVGAHAGERLCAVQADNKVVIDFKSKKANFNTVKRSAVSLGDGLAVTFPKPGSGVTISAP